MAPGFVLGPQAELTGRVVRAVEGPTPAPAVEVYTWTYHLGWSVTDEPNRRDLYVDVHLAAGPRGFDAVCGRIGTAGDGPGDLAVAIDPVPGVWLRSPVPKPWSFGWHSPTADEVLARLALEHGAPPAD